MQWESIQIMRKLHKLSLGVLFACLLTMIAAPGAVRAGDDNAPSLKASIKVEADSSGGRLTNQLGMSFVLIPAGRFQMGAFGGDGDVKGLPRHTVIISKPFYMQTTEVTQEQFFALMGYNNSVHKGNPRLPVEFVTWEEANEFVKLLNHKDPGKNYALPTEAQWEYACRAGGEGKWAFGDDPSQAKHYAWYEADTTQPVAQKRPNAWGLYDMHGNVWEWVRDYFAGRYLPTGTVRDPYIPNPRQRKKDDEGFERPGVSQDNFVPNNQRVMKGGSFRYGLEGMKSAYRTCFGAFTVKAKSYEVGFRVICSTD